MLNETVEDGGKGRQTLAWDAGKKRLQSLRYVGMSRGMDIWKCKGGREGWRGDDMHMAERFVMVAEGWEYEVRYSRW